MTYDPSQTYPSLGLYNGITTPGGLPYAALQASALNPAGALNALAATLGISNPAIGVSQAGQSPYPGISALGGNPQQLQQLQQQQLQQLQQLQAASILAAQAAIPQLTGAASFGQGQHNPLAAVHNALVAAALQNPLLTPVLAQLGYQSNGIYGQIGQNGSPFNQQQGQAYGQQQNPFAQQQGQAYGQQQNSPYGQQQGSPYGQAGYPLAPQSWVGQAGQTLGQINPLLAQINPLLAQLGVRPLGY
jgi:hypothetical protein